MCVLFYFFRTKNKSNDLSIPEWAIVELQGDLAVRSNKDIFGQFIGDLYYNKYGQPIFIIGHHILQGREQKIDKPYAVLEKLINDGIDLDQVMSSQIPCNTDLNSTNDRTIFDSTIALENKSKQKTEYKVRAIVSKKLIFKSRPKPIIANLSKQ